MIVTLALLLIVEVIEDEEVIDWDEDTVLEGLIDELDVWLTVADTDDDEVTDWDEDTVLEGLIDELDVWLTVADIDDDEVMELVAVTLEEIVMDFETVLLEDFVAVNDGEFETLVETVTVDVTLGEEETVELILELEVTLTEEERVTETDPEILDETVCVLVVDGDTLTVGVGDATMKSTSASTPVSLIDSSLFQRSVITRPVEYTMFCFGITGPDTLWINLLSPS